MCELQKSHLLVCGAQEIWLSTVAKVAWVGRDVFNIKWLSRGAPVAQRITLVLATHSQGSKWWNDEGALKHMKGDIDMLYVTKYVVGRVTPSRSFGSFGSVWTMALMCDQR